MKKKISVFLIAVGAVLITGCSTDKSTEQPKDGTELQEEMEAQDEIIKTKINEIEESLLVSDQSGFTDTVPDEYREKASKQGKVTQLDYFSKDYLNGEAETEKTAYVYTPAGYDEKDKGTKYDIIYLLHGWGGNAEDHFKKESTKNIIDNMIERGDIPPVIIVTPTLYTENSKKDFAGSLKEAKVFYRDFEENLMPEVETRFNTYAESTSQKGLEDSRDHRIFGGFSLGSVATWQILCNDFDYVSGYLPMSGACLYYGSFTDVQTEKNVDVIVIKIIIYILQRERRILSRVRAFFRQKRCLTEIRSLPQSIFVFTVKKTASMTGKPWRNTFITVCHVFSDKNEAVDGSLPHTFFISSTASLIAFLPSRVGKTGYACPSS